MQRLLRIVEDCPGRPGPIRWYRSSARPRRTGPAPGSIMRGFEYRYIFGSGFRAKRLRGVVVLSLYAAHAAIAQPLRPNPTPEMYVENNQGGSKVVPNGQ